MAQLRRLNLDSSWLLTLPTSHEHATRTVNILIDPWLSDAEQIDYMRAFSVQRRQTPALVPSVTALEALLESEAAVATCGDNTNATLSDQRMMSTRIDAILISHPFTDHMHPQTLANDAVCPTRIPFLATADAYAPLRALVGKSRTIVKIDAADMHQRPSQLFADDDDDDDEHVECASHPHAWMARNIALLHAVPRERMLMLQGPAGMAWQKLHGAVLVLWRDDRHAQQQHPTPHFHSLLYSPHGIAATSVPMWLSFDDAEKRVENWAIITSFDRIILPRWLSGTVNLGLAGALSLLSMRSTSTKHAAPPYAARYLVDTHGEHKQKAGLVAQLLRRFWLATTDEVHQLDPAKEQTRQQQAQQEVNNLMLHDTLPAVRSLSATRAVVLDVGQTLSLQQYSSS